jgi:hypothetical protein
MGPQISFGTHFWKLSLGDVLKVRRCIPPDGTFFDLGKISRFQPEESDLILYFRED